MKRTEPTINVRLTAWTCKECSVRNPEMLVPTIPGRNESMYSQVPQHPNGMREKNDRREARVGEIPEVPTTILLCAIGQALSLAYVTRKACAPVPMETPDMTHQFIVRAILTASRGLRLGVVNMTMTR